MTRNFSRSSLSTTEVITLILSNYPSAQIDIETADARDMKQPGTLKCSLLVTVRSPCAWSHKTDAGFII